MTAFFLFLTSSGVEHFRTFMSQKIRHTSSATCTPDACKDKSKDLQGQHCKVSQPLYHTALNPGLEDNRHWQQSPVAGESHQERLQALFFQAKQRIWSLDAAHRQLPNQNYSKEGTILLILEHYFWGSFTHMSTPCPLRFSCDKYSGIRAAEFCYPFQADQTTKSMRIFCSKCPSHVQHACQQLQEQR